MSEVNTESYKFIASVRFHNTKKPYTFGTNDATLEYGDFVVVETARGMEMGELISSLRDQESFTGPTALKPILRKATQQDREHHRENKDLAKDAMKRCSECIQQLGLDMNLISCEYTLDRTKVIFVYVSENRVDFRELLKELTQIFKCRIELRQIGPRDKAKMVGGLGACGLETCCSRFLDNFDVVSINMAKNQLLALNIPKLSGQCGKLMCCLKYEDELYKEMRQGLPKMNSQLEYEGKIYRLTSLNVITRQAKIENRESALFLSIDDLMAKAIQRKGAQQTPPKEEAKPEVQEKRQENHRLNKPNPNHKENRKPVENKPAEKPKQEANGESEEAQKRQGKNRNWHRRPKNKNKANES